MYQFQLTNGLIAKIYFSHKGGRKGTPAIPATANSPEIKAKPGKPPRLTTCTIVSETGVLLGSGSAAPVSEIVETLPRDIPVKYAQDIYGRQLKKIVKTSDGKTHVILKGDSFSRAKGRQESLKKALEPLDRADRSKAWEALHEEAILLTDVLSDLSAD
jgi:hypothetical protein